MDSRTAALRARMVFGWARAARREQANRDWGSGPASDPVEETLVGLESDLSYLEELPADRLAPVQTVLGEAGERLERLAASLKSRTP